MAPMADIGWHADPESDPPTQSYWDGSRWTQTQGLTAPGWYPDPTMAGTQRYWTGTEWSAHVAPVGGPPHQPSTGDSVLVAIGWAAAILLPLIGFVIGIVLMGKGEKDQGAWICVVSIAIGLAGCALVLYT